MIEYLVDHGHDVYLLDWGEIAEEDKGLGFEEAVFKLIPRAIDRALEASGARELTINGICLGGTLSACYLAIHPDAPVRNFVAIVAPIDFEKGGLFRVWLDERYFPADLRLFERVIGLEEQLDDLEDQNRRIINNMAAPRRARPKPASETPEPAEQPEPTEQT